MYIVAKQLDGSRWHLAWRGSWSRPHCARWGPSSPLPKKGFYKSTKIVGVNNVQTNIMVWQGLVGLVPRSSVSLVLAFMVRVRVSLV